MGQAATRIAGCLGFLLVLLGTSGWATAALITTCPPNGNLTALSTPSVADVGANGFLNTTCDLKILETVPVTIINLSITAQSLAIGGASHVDIINDILSSSITLRTTGNISLDNASLKAHKNLRIDCTGTAPPCTFTSDNGSELIVATDPGFDAVPLGGGGVMLITTQGPISIHNTAIHAGDTFHFTSKLASVTLGPCPGGTVGVCTDPLVSKSPAECFNPQGQFIPNCTPTFATADDLRAVCFPGTPGLPCNGGNKQKDITAATFIDIRGVELTSEKHVVLTCGTELLGSDAKITVFNDKILVKCGGKIDFTNAELQASLNIEVTSSCTGITPPSPCVDATGADMQAREVKLTATGGGTVDATNANLNNTGTKFPTLNGDSTPTPTYPATVITTGLTVCRNFGNAATQECLSF